MKSAASLLCNAIYLASVCGASTALLEIPTILGGFDAKISQFSYQASIRYRGCHSCGGAILSRWFVLSAAHCVTQMIHGEAFQVPKELLTIRAGSESLFSREVVRNVSRIKIHEKFGRYFNNLTRSWTLKGSLLHDLAVIRISEPFTFGKRVAPITISSQKIPRGAKIVVSGWGFVNGDKMNETLQFVPMSSVGFAETLKSKGRAAVYLLYLRHPIGKGTCQGDSGGPAVFRKKLVGISSFISDKCGSKHPDGFVNVPHYYKWIVRHARIHNLLFSP